MVTTTKTPHDLEVFLQQETFELRALLKRTSEHIAVIGHRLITVRARLGSEKQFNTWCADGLGIAHSTADNFMNAATFLENHPSLGHHNLEVIYLLASPKCPEEIVQGVEDGQIEADIKTLKELKRDYSEDRGDSGSGTSRKLTPRQVIEQVIAIIQKSELYTVDLDDTLVDRTAEAVDAVYGGIKNGILAGRNRREKTEAGLLILATAIEAVLVEDED